MMKVHYPLIQVKVLVNGKPIQEYHKDQQTFIEGRKGSNFELYLKNLTGRRLLVHPTVDGLSCMTGEEASRNDHSNGYVLNAYQEMTVPGWRLDNDSVARFFFAGEGKSYAEKTGRPLNKGVIAAAIWEEKRWSWCSKDPIWFTNTEVNIPNISFGSTTCGYSNPHGIAGNDVDAVYSCNVSHQEPTSGDLFSPKNVARGQSEMFTQPETQNLGTGFGKQAEHKVYEVHFVPEQEEPNAVAVIYYDDFRGLQKRGIKVQKIRDRRPGLPNPFPRGTGCTPPDGWRG
jgi:hypothetical protein